MSVGSAGDSNPRGRRMPSGMRRAEGARAPGAVERCRRQRGESLTPHHLNSWAPSKGPFSCLWAVLGIRTREGGACPLACAGRRARERPEPSSGATPGMCQRAHSALAGSNPRMVHEYKKGPIAGTLDHSGGELGIRTPDRIESYTRLAGEHLRPLGQLSVGEMK